MQVGAGVEVVDGRVVAVELVLKTEPVGVWVFLVLVLADVLVESNAVPVEVLLFCLVLVSVSISEEMLVR